MKDDLSTFKVCIACDPLKEKAMRHYVVHERASAIFQELSLIKQKKFLRLYISHFLINLLNTGVPSTQYDRGLVWTADQKAKVTPEVTSL